MLENGHQLEGRAGLSDWQNHTPKQLLRVWYEHGCKSHFPIVLEIIQIIPSFGEVGGG